MPVAASLRAGVWMAVPAWLALLMATLPAPGWAAPMSQPEAADTATPAAEPVDLYYFERPPYVARRSGSGAVSGLTAAPAERAFRDAGIAFRWVELPTVRQLVTLQGSTRPACALGWFRNAERLQQFKFTRALYRDRPTVAIARADLPVPADATLAEVMAVRGLRVLVKDGFSYGPLVDGRLASLRTERVFTSAESVAMVRMVAGARAHLMFAAEEEAGYLLDTAGVAPGRLKLLHFAELPPGEPRHLLCSKATPDALIERLDRAIAEAAERGG